MNYIDWNIEELTGYKPITTFYSDFSIADKFGVNAIKDTFNRAVEWLDDYKYFTELIMALNWKIWEHYKVNNKYAELYNKLWEIAQSMFFKKYKENDEVLKYYYRTTD